MEIRLIKSVPKYCIVLAMCFILTASYIPANTPLFTENKGQILDQNHVSNNDVLFMYTGKGLKIQLRKTGYSYELFNVNNLPQAKTGHKLSENPEQFSKTFINSHRVDIDFMGANAAVEILKEGKSTGVLNYFVCGKEIANINSFSKVIYKNIYNNIDIEFVLSGSQSSTIKYNIILHPGADINAIKFLCEGASVIKQNHNGEMIFSTTLGDICENIPFSYYTSTPQLNNKVDFKLSNNIISFSANYDNSKTFVIDPSTNRIWGTYFGGTSLEYCTSTGTDASNNVYIGGYCLSTSNIATSGVYQATLNGSFDAYLSKFNSNGAQLWGTYFGGPSFDVFYTMHVMPSGIVYAAGDTGSTVTVASAAAHQTVYAGGVDDAIVVKFDANGQRLWSTYNGGTLHDIAEAVTVDSNGDVIISGHTESTTGIATAGVYGPVYGLNYDVFITKFNTNGVRLWGTYYGDTGIDEAYGLTTDATNNIYVTGMTNSVFGIATGSAYQTLNAGIMDAFIAKFDPTGVNLIWATYYGGVGDDKGTAIKTDLTTGNVYLAGNTTSTNNISSVGAYQTNIGSADDAFITAFNSSGSRLWGTYYGGNDVDYINDLILDADKNILVGGQTLSTNAMSSAGAYQLNIAAVNFYDAFFAKFGNNGIRKEGTYFGGPDNDMANGIAVDNANKIYIAGETTSTVSISTPGSHQQIYSGGADAFLAKFCIAPEPTVTPSGSTTTCVNTNYTLTATGGFSSYLWNIASSSNPLAITGGSVAGTFYYAITVTDVDGCSGTSDSTIVIVSLCTSVDELNLETSLTIFPVPAMDFINLQVKNKTVGSNIIIEMYSALGEMVLKSESIEPTTTISIKNLSSGIYFLRCKDGMKITDKKIIIQ